MSVLRGGRPLRRLRDVADIRPGRTPKALDRYLAENPRSDRVVPFFKVGDMNGDPRVLRQARTYLAEAELDRLGVSVLPVGSAIFPKAGGAIATNKKRLIAFSGAIDLNCMGVVPGSMLESRYLFAWLQSLDLRDIADGSVLPQISKGRVESLLIPLPALEEQRHIVEILEDHLSRLDAAARNLVKGERRLTGLVRGLLESAVPIPGRESWSQTTVAAAGRLQLGRQRHPDWHHGPNMRPYLRVANVFEDRIDTSDVKEMDFTGSFDTFRLSPGDVLLNEGQSPHLLGRPAIYRGDPPDVAFTNSLIRFQANADVLPEWALLVFRRHMHSGRFMKESRITTNIAHLSLSRLKGVEFPLPPIEEQRQLVATAAEQLEGIERLRTSVLVTRRRGFALRRALLDAAFSGRLTGASADTEVIEDLANV